jgi:hypothetical protein
MKERRVKEARMNETYTPEEARMREPWTCKPRVGKGGAREARATEPASHSEPTATEATCVCTASQ